jgi:hypothetical protein
MGMAQGLFETFPPGGKLSGPLFFDIYLFEWPVWHLMPGIDLWDECPTPADTGC